MEKSYKSNYFKIYIWQGISIALNLASMLIVIPKLSGEPSIYGIYSLCIAVNIYLSYADIGFMGAGIKYASEAFARKDLQQEIRLVGFVCFILFLFVLMYACILVFLSFYPELLISHLIREDHHLIASRLLLILGLFAPSVVLQRLLQIIFGIRLEDYIYQRITLFSSILKIASIFYFFSATRYDVIGYFLFSQVLTVFSLVISLYLAHKRYNYDFLLLLRCFRFSKEIFNSTKRLALSSFFVTILWILFYEMDYPVISKFLGPDALALYAVGFSLIGYLRTFLGIFFTPFSARFNHFKGLNDITGLKNIVWKVILLSLPLVVFPILSLSLFLKPFIFSWVGADYARSVSLATFLILCNVFAFVAYPGSYLIIVREKIKEIYWLNVLTLAIYWIGIFFTFEALGLSSFALFKFIAFTFSAIFYMFNMKKFLDFPTQYYVKKIFFPLLLSSLIIVVVALLTRDTLPTEKNITNFLIISSYTGLLSIVGIFVFYFSCSEFKMNVSFFLKKS